MNKYQEFDIGSDQKHNPQKNQGQRINRKRFPQKNKINFIRKNIEQLKCLPALKKKIEDQMQTCSDNFQKQSEKVVIQKYNGASNKIRSQQQQNKFIPDPSQKTGVSNNKNHFRLAKVTIIQNNYQKTSLTIQNIEQSTQCQNRQLKGQVIMKLQAYKDKNYIPVKQNLYQKPKQQILPQTYSNQNKRLYVSHLLQKDNKIRFQDQTRQNNQQCQAVFQQTPNQFATQRKENNILKVPTHLSLQSSTWVRRQNSYMLQNQQKKAFSRKNQLQQASNKDTTIKNNDTFHNNKINQYTPQAQQTIVYPTNKQIQKVSQRLQLLTSKNNTKSEQKNKYLNKILQQNSDESFALKQQNPNLGQKNKLSHSHKINQEKTQSSNQRYQYSDNQFQQFQNSNDLNFLKNRNIKLLNIESESLYFQKKLKVEENKMEINKIQDQAIRMNHILGEDNINYTTAQNITIANLQQQNQSEEIIFLSENERCQNPNIKLNTLSTPSASFSGNSSNPFVPIPASTSPYGSTAVSLASHRAFPDSQSTYAAAASPDEPIAFITNTMPSSAIPTIPKVMDYFPKNSDITDSKRGGNDIRDERSGHFQPRKIGFTNSKQTCYMNSVLQCLINSEGFFNFFAYSMQEKKLAIEFENICKYFNKEQLNKKAYNAENLKMELCERDQTFVGSNQQDAHEFLRALLDGLHEDLNEIKEPIPYKPFDAPFNIPIPDLVRQWRKYSIAHDRSIVFSSFQGNILNSIQCKSCSSKTLTCQNFLDLSIPISEEARNKSHQPLDSILRSFFLQTGKFDSFTCEKCQNCGSAEEKVNLSSLPKFLVLHIKRFSVNYDNRGNQILSKINTKISFPTTTKLDMKPYLNPAMKMENEDYSYSLYGIVHHSGSIKGGHYNASCKNPIDKTWNKFDDSYCYPIDQKELHAYEVQGSSNPYILFYERISQS